MTGPLSGVRVVEFGNLIAAPHAAMMLADFGADVIKVEPPTGDLGRAFGPQVDGESAFFLAANRGKRSVVIDVRSAEGRAQALALAAGADVVISNLRTGAMERSGLGEADIRAVNPSVVYAVVSAFAPTGPEAERAGIDVVFQAEAGMISISGDEGGPLSKTATTVGDYMAATNVALAICAALVDRATTGRGRRVDVSLRDGLIAIQAGWNALAFTNGVQPERRGTASPYLAPNQVFETADGHLAIAIISERHWAILCESLDRPDLAERYPDNDYRMDHARQLADELTGVFVTGTTDHWVGLLGDAGLAIGVVRDLFGAFEAAPHMKLELGVMPITGSAISVDGHQVGHTHRAPQLGEHTAEILAELD
jgi:CoA:oxalate CoA-transferase